MKRLFLFIFAIFTLPLACFSQISLLPSPWTAGEKVAQDYPENAEWFEILEIPDSLFSLMKGKSFKDDCTVPRNDLRYLRMLHKNLDGDVMMGEMVCHKDVTPEMLEIFRELYRQDYPIERMVLIDVYGADDVASMEANNTTCFNFRHVDGSKKLSNHARGMAVDINPLYNPYVKKRKDGTLYVSPEEGRGYLKREKSVSPYIIVADDAACRLFKAHGFGWGGDYKSLKDYQHFEKK